MYSRLILITLLVLVSLAHRLTPTSTAQGTTYTDPFAYCAAVGTIDAPDAHYVGPNVPDAIVRGLEAALQSPPGPPAGISWRCMEGQVYACTVGANLPCTAKANTNQTPTADMTTYCQTNANAPLIPAFVTGPATVYEWSCVNGVATSGRQGWQVDAQGFIANIWYAISSQGTGGPQTMPAAGGAPLFAQSTTLLVVLAAGAVLLGLVLRRRLHRGSANT